MNRRSIGTGMSLCVHPAFIIGTNNADGSANFAPITWVSATCAGGDRCLLVVSMFGMYHGIGRLLGRIGDFAP